MPLLKTRPPVVSGQPSWLLAAPLAYLTLLFLLPIASLFVLAGGWRTYTELAASVNWSILANTFRLAFLVTAISLAIGYPLAYLARTAGDRARAFILACATIPMWTSLLARSYAWISVLDRRGLVNSLLLEVGLVDHPLRLLHTTGATLVGSVYIMLPLMTLSLYAQMAEIDMLLMRAARTLAARPAQVFVRVFLPLSLPGVFSGSLLVFIVSLGFFVTPALLGGPGDRTFSMLISQQIDTFGNFGAAAALANILLIATIICLILFGAAAGFEGLLGRSVRRSQQGTSLGPWATRVLLRLSPLLALVESRLLWHGFLALVLLFLFLPLATLVPMSFGAGTYLQFPPDTLSTRWYNALFSDPRWISAGLSSFAVAAAATVLATIVGVTAALGLRHASGGGARVAFALFLAPSMIPTMVYALAAYFGAVILGLVDSVFGLALAHSVLALPFVVVICATGLGEIGPAVEQAAQSLGAGWWRRLWRITLPLLLGSIIVGALVAFQTSFDEVVVALFLSGVETRTLPKIMWQAATLEVTPIIPAAAVVVLLIGAVVAAAGFSAFFLRAGRRHRRSRKLGMMPSGATSGSPNSSA